MTTDLIFQYYYRPLCLYALHYLGNVDEAEDAVQDCFVRLVELREQTSESVENNVRGWLYTAVRNRCIDLLRQRKGRTEILPTDADGPITDEEAQERSTEEARLWTAIDALPDRCREVFLMAKRDGMHQADIAQELNISPRTVEHQVAKALRILRGKASDFFRMLFCAA